MPKINIVYYLTGYDTKIRQEFEVDPDKPEDLTKAGENFIKRFGKGWSNKTIGRIVHDEIVSVKKHSRAGIDIKPYKKIHTSWTTEDEDILKAQYKTVPIRMIASTLKKTMSGIYTKASRLDLTR